MKVILLLLSLLALNQAIAQQGPSSDCCAHDQKPVAAADGYDWIEASEAYVYDSKGNYIERNTTIALATVPAQVKDAFNTTLYSDWNLKGVKQVEKNGEKYYRFYISLYGDSFRLSIAPDGTIIQDHVKI